MTKAEEIFKNMREEMPWSIIGEKQLKPYILEAMEEYGKYCAEIALDDGFNLGFIECQRPSFEDWWSAFQKKESTK